jgi:hypothetical protein
MAERRLTVFRFLANIAPNLPVPWGSMRRKQASF